MFPRPRSIIKFPDSARNRNPEEYKGTVFYRTFVLLAPFYNSGTRCIYIYYILLFLIIIIIIIIINNYYYYCYYHYCDYYMYFTYTYIYIYIYTYCMYIYIQYIYAYWQSRVITKNIGGDLFGILVEERAASSIRAQGDWSPHHVLASWRI